MAKRYFMMKISGVPVSRLSCILNRSPLWYNAFRSFISGFVFLERMRAMFREVFLEV
jgi:hypothetical protein